ncbi:MAG: hypothetical protein ACK5T6_08200 [Pirellula sp.]|jgi:hypothetical protein
MALRPEEARVSRAAKTAGGPDVVVAKGREIWTSCCGVPYKVPIVYR